MKTLWLRPILPGGPVKVTRAPSCAAAAKDIVTFNPSIEIPAAWAGYRGRRAVPLPLGSWGQEHKTLDAKQTNPRGVTK